MTKNEKTAETTSPTEVAATSTPVPPPPAKDDKQHTDPYWSANSKAD